VSSQSLQLNYAATTPSHDAAATKQEVNQVRPWVRYWARVFDIYLWSILAGFCVGAMSDFLPDSLTRMPDIGFGLLFLAVWIFVEALFISSFGWTPGKLLFKTAVETSDGELLSYDAALRRSTRVWWRGLAMGLPLISLATLLRSKSRLEKEGVASWDKDGDFVVMHDKVNGLSVLFVIAFFGVVAPALFVLRIQNNEADIAAGRATPSTSAFMESHLAGQSTTSSAANGVGENVVWDDLPPIPTVDDDQHAAMAQARWEYAVKQLRDAHPEMAYGSNSTILQEKLNQIGGNGGSSYSRLRQAYVVAAADSRWRMPPSPADMAAETARWNADVATLFREHPALNYQQNATILQEKLDTGATAGLTNRQMLNNAFYAAEADSRWSNGP
jgi:hypothetical protein